MRDLSAWVRSLSVRLRDAEPEERIRIIDDLAGVGSELALDAIRARLFDPAPEVAGAAVRALARPDPAGLASTLVSGLELKRPGEGWIDAVLAALLESAGGESEAAPAPGAWFSDEPSGRTLATLARTAPDAVRAWARAVLERDDIEDVGPLAAIALGEVGRLEDCGLLRGFLRGWDEALCLAAAMSAARLAARYEPSGRLLARLLREPESAARAAAVRGAAAARAVVPERVVRTILNDSSAAVRAAGVRHLPDLAPDLIDELAAPALADGDVGVVDEVLSMLGASRFGDQVADVIGRAMSSASPATVDALLEWLAERSPAALPEAVGGICRSPNDELREAAPGALASLPQKVCPDGAEEHDSPAWQAVVEGLARLTEDASPAVREKALIALTNTDSARAASVARTHLQDAEVDIRLAALQAVEADQDPALLDDFVALARDPDDGVRWNALQVLGRRDDPRVIPEIVSCLSDEDGQVRELAAELLAEKVFGGRGEGEEEGEEAGPPTLPEAVAEVQARLAALFAWAETTGRTLLGREVRVVRHRGRLGRTKLTRRGEPVVIEVSDAPLAVGHPHGEDIVRGLVMHEIGHHLYDAGARGFRAACGAARAEGVEAIFDILLDERLERALRSRRAEWGVWFDRLASYAFAQKAEAVPLEEYARLLDKSPDATRAAIEGGEVPGRMAAAPAADGRPLVELRPVEVLSMPGLWPPQAAFLSCLRGGLDPRLSRDPAVPTAVKLVPRNLKDLTHREVLAVARRIGEVLGRDRDAAERMREMAKRAPSLGGLGGMMSEAVRRLRSVSSAIDDLARAAEARDRPGAARRRDHGAAAEFGEESEERVPAPQRRPAGRRTLASWRRPRPENLGGDGMNLAPEERFDALEKEVVLPFDADRHARLVRQILPHIRILRSYLERLGTRSVEEHGSRAGRRLDLAKARRVAAVVDPAILVRERVEQEADAYIGVLIDRSGSMDGAKIERARAFGVLLCEAARGIRGITGHVNAFDDDTFYRLGSFRRCSVASLEAGGGNNDSGALSRAASLALASRKRNRLLVMISDGEPTECTFASLKALVARLAASCGIVCVQVAVDRLEEVAFPEFVDLTEASMDESVARFGRLIMRLTASW